MNKSYRNVSSDSLETWVAVSGATSAHSKKSKPSTAASAIALLIATAGFNSGAQANFIGQTGGAATGNAGASGIAIGSDTVTASKAAGTAISSISSLSTGLSTTDSKS